MIQTDEPKTQAELEAYIASTACIEIVWSAVEQHYYKAIRYTLFDKSVTQEWHDNRGGK